MKIDFFPQVPDRDPPLKTTPRDDDTRRDQGRAFDAAVRDAKPPQRDTAGADNRAPAPSASADAPSKPANGQDASGARSGTDKAADAKASKSAAQDSQEADSKDADAADASQAESADKRALQSLLGLLNHGLQTDDGQPPSTDEKAATRTLVPSGTDQALDAEAGEGAGGKSVRLEVLKMETHFEPHQNGMVLVQAGGADAGRKTAADVKAAEGKSKSDASASALLASLSDKTKAAAAALEGNERVSAKGGAAGDAQQQNDAALPLRFDEALARLSDRGRAGADDGGERRGDAQRAALSDAAKGSDAATGGKTTSVDGIGFGAGTGGLGLATQIADRMLEVLGEPSARPSSAATPDHEAHLRMRAGGAALKTLTIQLKPEHLGTLDVSMRLSEGKLTVELAASRADTAVLLAEDRGALRQLLERAGFSLDDAAITVVAKDIQPNATRAADGSATAGNDNSGSNGASGQAARDGSSARDDQAGGRRSPAAPPRDAAAAEDASRGRRASTYL